MARYGAILKISSNPSIRLPKSKGLLALLQFCGASERMICGKKLPGKGFNITSHPKLQDGACVGTLEISTPAQGIFIQALQPVQRMCA